MPAQKASRRGVRYLVVIQFKGDTPIARIKRDAPDLIASLKNLSTGESELAFRSGDSMTFGYLIQSTRTEWEIREGLQATTSLVHGDKALILELGGRSAEIGLVRPKAWIDHH